MTYTEEHLSALREAAASGVKSVTFEGRTVVYYSLTELRQLIASIEAQLRPVGAIPTGYNPTYSKGT